MNQTVGIGFLTDDNVIGYNWVVIQIPVPDMASPSGPQLVTKLNLDDLFNDRETSIRFKGYSRSGRPLYTETNLFRKHPQNMKKEKLNYYLNEQYRQESK